MTPDNDIVDLNALRAEARATQKRFRFGDHVYAFPLLEEWPVQAVELMLAGSVLEALELLLTPEEHERFTSERPSLGDLRRIHEALVGGEEEAGN